MTTTQENPATTAVNAALSNAVAQLGEAVAVAEDAAEWRHFAHDIDPSSVVGSAGEIVKLIEQLLTATGRAAVRHAQEPSQASEHERRIFDHLTTLATRTLTLREQFDAACVTT